MKKYFAIYFVLFVSLLMSSCEFSNYPHLSPQEILNDKDEKYQWEKVYIEGLVGMPSEQVLEALGVKSTMYKIILTHESGNAYPTVSISIGDSINQMKPIPESYNKEHLHIIDKHGKAIKVGDRVRILGEVNYNTRTNYNTMKEEKHCVIFLRDIEKL